MNFAKYTTAHIFAKFKCRVSQKSVPYVNENGSRNICFSGKNRYFGNLRHMGRRCGQN